MATAKKTTAKRTSSRGGKRKLTKKERQARNQLWAILLFALGILLLCLAVIPGENAWLAVHNFLLGCLSWCAYLVGPVVLYTAVMIATDKTNYPTAAKTISASVLVLLLSGALQIFHQEYPQGNFLRLVKGLFADGQELTGGGVFSLVFGVPLLKFTNFAGAAIIIILLIFIVLMILSGGTLMGLIRGAAAPVKKLEEAYSSAVENRSIREGEAAKAPKEQSQEDAPLFPFFRRRFNINVPIDGEPLPQHGNRAPKTALRPDPLPPQERERLVDEVGDLPRKGPYDFDRQDPAAKAGPKEELTQKAAQLAQEDEAPSIDDLIVRAVSGDTQLPKIPETPAGKLDFGGAVPAPAAAAAAAAERLPKASPAPASPAPASSTPGEGPHPDNTVAPSMEESPQEKPQYTFPPLNLLDEPRSTSQQDTTRELRQNAELLENTLKSFGVQARIIDVSRGPAVTRYELQPAAGVKISRVTGLADDIALNLSAAGVRIEAPIPGKPAIGIEVPNKVISTVSIKEIIDSASFQNAGSPLTVALGKDITGGVAVADIAKMPHVLIAGATGSGKSVCINSIIISLLYKSSPEQVKFLMIDPKVVELGVYNGIPHLLVPVVTDPKKAAGALCWAVGEMLRRYKTFADTGVRDIKGYNRLAEENGDLPPMPQMVIIIDELADLMMASPKDVEDYICRLAQMARAAGMHLVIATQRPSVDVITGLIKANIPSRISFAVSSAVDSRTILDGGGAEKLLGRGDMLFAPVGAPKPMRIQGCFVTDQEVERVVTFVKEGEKPDYDQEVIQEIDRQAAASGKNSPSGGDSGEGGEDELLNDAIEVVVEAGLASTSLLQRRLKVGYARAARLVDEMEQRGIVGPFEGSKPRQVLLTKDRWYEMKLNNGD
jgi:DNA segregation ATPase FtsK/SpoIIIE-like protein